MKAQKVIKAIKIQPEKCTGCRTCELYCAAYHATPRYSHANPAKARIRVFVDELNDVYLPIISGRYVAESECNIRYRVVIGGRDYDECTFCRAVCPSRKDFFDPDTGLPLLCDGCGEPMPEGGPMCVQACDQEALLYMPERVEEIEVPEVEEEEVEEL
ncbi:MAG: (4Fe-4S)-binding protein [Deltaproteobacteria bacterium]|nr:MAG: (4Fe-4S)-binding protein [Deltaproteobacteria bacterium]